MEESLLNAEKVASYSQLYNVLFDFFAGDICSSKFAITGLPRNDLLIRCDGRKNLKYLFPELATQKVVMYAPVFRESPEYEFALKKGAFYLWEDYDAQDLENFLAQENITLIVKMHNIEKVKFAMQETAHFKIIEEEKLKAAGIHFYEVLCGADALISDYSHTWVDYLLLNRPVIFAVKDLEEYKMVHGMMLEPFDAWAPGEIVVNMKELKSAIASALYTDKFAEKRAALASVFHKFLDGNASMRVVVEIRKLIKQ